MENMREKLKDMEDQFRKSNIFLAGIPERTENTREKNYQRKGKSFQIEGARTMNEKLTHSRHIIMKFQYQIQRVSYKLQREENCSVKNKKESD